MRRIKRILSVSLIMLMMFGLLPWTSVISFAKDMGNDVIITDVRFTMEHDGFDTAGAYIEISGSGLSNQIWRFEVSGIGGGLQVIGTQTDDEDGFVKFTFTDDEALTLTGRFRVANEEIQLNLNNFPNLDGASRKNVNVDQYTGTDSDDENHLILTGSYLDEIDADPNLTAEFGRVQVATFGDNDPVGTVVGADGKSIDLLRPEAPGAMGYQNIRFKRTETDVPDDLTTTVEYLYANVFRFVENVGLTTPTLFPNTGAKDEFAYIYADDFNDTKEYAVFFLKELDGSDEYTEINKAETVALSIDQNGDEDKLTIKVPSSDDFDLRSYYVVITNTLNDEIIAEQIIYDDIGDEEQFTVIGSGYQPTIENIFPDQGPDTGGNVQISGRNLITLNIPDLIASGDIATPGGSFNDPNPWGENADKELRIQYENGTYRGEEVTIERTLTIQIGKQAFFAKNTDGDFSIIQGTPDSIIVTTDTIDDANEDPFKDVVVQMSTVLEEVNTTKTYTFNQVVTEFDGFEYIPSTYTPVIETINPEQIQIESFATEYKFSEDTLFAVKGDYYLVDRIVDDNGDVQIKYPTVLFKKSDDNTFLTKYQVGFFPNEEYEGVRGIIKYKLDEEGATEYVLEDASSDPVPLEMYVINEDGELVDGTEGNDIGVKILVMIPNSAIIKDGGIKHVQVTNPRRSSDDYGNSAIRSDVVNFLVTSDVPVIESVEPNIVTVDGGQEVVITGSNFKEGLKIYLDGEEITSFDRDIDSTGNKILLTFEAPEGREGTTQIQVINPSGGLAVYDFTYVGTFDKDPEVTDFSPDQGTSDTLVVVNGDNFLKPDPTVSTTSGLDGFRLIGSRIFLDGQDVNDYYFDAYGNIDFRGYTSPANEQLITMLANKAVYSNFVDNVYIQRASDSQLFYLGNDKDNNPSITNYDGVVYTIKYDTGSSTNYYAYDGDDVLLGEADIANYAAGVTTMNMPDGETFNAYMDNYVINVKKDGDNINYVDISDYAESLILSDGSTYYTLFKNLSDEVRLTDGQENNYTISYDVSGSQIVAVKDSGGTQVVTVASDRLTIGTTDFTYITPYEFDAITKEITGDRTRVVSKNQITFYVPTLTTGKGYKDLFVYNPDTKNAGFEGDDGFYYITSSSSHPVITEVDPRIGSVDGGYIVTIYGDEFEDNMKVYIDSVMVPEEETTVALDGTSVTILIPEYRFDLVEEYAVDSIDVSVIVVNADGGSAYRENGFTYIIPNSSPVIEYIIGTSGSANGGEIVEIIGYEFRFYEPYENIIGGPEYDIGDEFTDLYKNSIWDDLLDSGVDPGAITTEPELLNAYYSEYYVSNILPTVLFGEEEAYIVEYAKGYIKVISPPHAEGTVDVYVINNDSGVSNKIEYDFIASDPSIDTISPERGKRSGQEFKDLYGSSFFKSNLYGYQDDDATTTTLLDEVDAMVRFGDIDNYDIARLSANSGLINSERAEINLTGNLKVNYYGDTDRIVMAVEENGKVYQREFTNYDDTEVFIPMEMLMNGTEYYVPYGLSGYDGSSYTGADFEFIRIYIEDRRVIVERGYSPKVNYDSTAHVEAKTPSYYTIGDVDVFYTNPDGGQATIKFEYTNPDSEPKIYQVKPFAVNSDGDEIWVENSIQGGMQIEVIGLDFRDNAKAYIGNKSATVVEQTIEVIDNVTYDVLIIEVPSAGEADIDSKYPIVVENEDSGLANSITLENLVGPNYGTETLPIYFVYRQPLSSPAISNISPSETSVAGGNTITITGSDFRAGAYVIVGSKSGVPITEVTISDRGTVISFTTPENMTLGLKDVQVINEDFGIAIEEDGLNIISAPTVTGIYESTNNYELERVSVEGGTEITIRGTNFLENATVVFGGVRSVYTDSTKTGEYGLYVDDDYYRIENGLLGSSVTYVDSETIKVTTPAFSLEDDVIVTVINSDNGISDSNETLTYRVPVPSDPVGLKVELIDDRYIKLYDYYSESVDYYEIYTYIGTKTSSQIITNDYRDMQYLNVTNVEPYKITSLKGVEDMESGDVIWFVLKAVNMYGASSYSNLAFLTYEQVKDVERIGPEDIDGGTGVPDGLDYEHITNNNQSTINLAEDLSPSVAIVLSDYELDGINERVINVPENAVRVSSSLILVDYGDSKLQFLPLHLNTTAFRNLALNEDAYGRIVNSIIDDEFASVMKSSLPRGKKAVTKVYKMDFMAVSNSTVDEMETINAGMMMQFGYSEFLTMAEEAQLGLYKYNSSTYGWDLYPSTLDTVNNTVTLEIREPGHYILLTNR